MSKLLSISELSKMQKADLLREIAEQRRTVAHLGHRVHAGIEKGSHLLQRAEKQLSRMLTVLSSLPITSSESTMLAPTSSSPSS